MGESSREEIKNLVRYSLVYLVVFEGLYQFGPDGLHRVLDHGFVDLEAVGHAAVAEVHGLADVGLLDPVPEVHGVGLVLSLGEVVQTAVVQALQDEVQLVVGRHPRVKPSLMMDL